MVILRSVFFFFFAPESRSFCALALNVGHEVGKQNHSCCLRLASEDLEKAVWDLEPSRRELLACLNLTLLKKVGRHTRQHARVRITVLPAGYDFFFFSSSTG